MSVPKLSERAMALYREVGEDVYTVAAQAMVLATIERIFMVSLRMLR